MGDTSLRVSAGGAMIPVQASPVLNRSSLGHSSLVRRRGGCLADKRIRRSRLLGPTQVRTACPLTATSFQKIRPLKAKMRACAGDLIEDTTARARASRLHPLLPNKGSPCRRSQVLASFCSGSRLSSRRQHRGRGGRGDSGLFFVLSLSGFSSLKGVLLKQVKRCVSSFQSLGGPRQAGIAFGAFFGLVVFVDFSRFLASIPPGGGGGGKGPLGWFGNNGALQTLTELYRDEDEDEEDEDEGGRRRRRRKNRFIGSGAEPTVIYDVRGRVIATLMLSPSGGISGGAEKAEPQLFGVPLRLCSDCTWQAIVASEDKRFFRHKGVDLFGLARAILSLGRLGGGSTITQQLAKNVALSHSRTLTRKAVELVLAMNLERKLSKQAILEAYLNSVYWGHGLWGIAGASAVYFRKKPSELVLGEAALLAGILPAPEHLSPFRNPEGALRARASVLQRMLAAGYITEKEALKVAKGGLPKSMSLTIDNLDGNGSQVGAAAGDSRFGGPTKSGVPFRAPFFVAEVLYQLRELLNDKEVLKKGGLQIHTTLDLALQERAEQILMEDGRTLRLGEDKGESALVAMEPDTGAVRVLVGGRSYSKSPYNRAMLARRQPGSAFKPVVYLAALATGLVTPKTELEDEEVVFKRVNYFSPGDKDDDRGDEFTSHYSSSSYEEGGSTQQQQWVAISKKDKQRSLLEKAEERRALRDKHVQDVKRLQEEDRKMANSHTEKKDKVRRKLAQMQKKLAEFEADMNNNHLNNSGGGGGGDSPRTSPVMDKLLVECDRLEEQLTGLEENEPLCPDPLIEELQQRIANWDKPKKQGKNNHHELINVDVDVDVDVDDEDDLYGDHDDKSANSYQPQNYSRKYRGVVTLRESLADSLNVPTVKLANLIGLDQVVGMARKLGIRGKLPLDLSLALGSCEVTPFELAHVFNTIAAGGVCSRPHLITRVTATGQGSGSDQLGLGLGLGLSSKSQVLYKHRSKKKVVVSRHICQDLHRMLRSAVTRGTGRPATKGWPSVLAAGKTGTSDDYRDAWFAGYTPSLTCVVWCGRDDNSSLPGSGATLAAPLWAKFMRAASGTGGYATDKGQSNKRAKKKNKNTFMR